MENTHLQPVSQLVRKAWELYRQRFDGLRTLMFALFLVNLVPVIMEPSSPDPLTWSIAFTGGSIIVSLIAAVLTYFGTIALTYGIGTGHSLSIKEAWNVAWSKAWPYFWTSLLSGLVVLAGIILFVVPGIIWMVQLLFVGMVVLFEDLRGRAALGRSRQYVKGHWWAVVGRGIVLILLMIPVYIILGILTAVLNKLGGIANLAASFFLIIPFSTAYLYGLYTDLKS